MSGEYSVQVSPQASKDLRQLGPITRRLVRQALEDELRTPAPSLMGDDEDATDPRGRQVLPLGNYRVVFTTTESEHEGSARVVLRIVHEDDLDATRGVPEKGERAFEAGEDKGTGRTDEIGPGGGGGN